MLVLRRKVGQRIIIAGNIRITVFALQGQQVKIGIEAQADERQDGKGFPTHKGSSLGYPAYYQRELRDTQI